MNRSSKIINFYLIRSFLKNLFIIFISIVLLSFIINLFDTLNISKHSDSITFYQIFILTLLQIPSFIADIAVFLVMISSMVTLYNLCAKSEITIMRSVGMSMWRILTPLIITNFIIGLIFIFIFLPLTILSTKQYSIIKNEIIGHNQEISFAPQNGIWLKQDNAEIPGEEIKIRSDRVYRDSLRFKNVTIWFFNKDDVFYKKLDVAHMRLSGGKWLIKSAILNDNDNINKEINNVTIATNLEADFINQKVINNFEDVKLFSIFDLPELINNLESAGFSSRKFKVYFHSLLNYPLLFISVSLIAAYFSINNVRDKNNILYIICGIIFGLINYVGLNIMSALGSSGIIPCFMATWLITLLFLAVSVILVFRKE